MSPTAKKINLIKGSVPEPVAVPHLIGIPLKQALRRLEASGLIVTVEPSEADPQSLVIDQSLRAGGAQAGDQITISVSN